MNKLTGLPRKDLQVFCLKPVEKICFFLALNSASVRTPASWSLPNFSKSSRTPSEFGLVGGW